jgi:protocatechuate 3,4-dioxygenase beta subunit
MYPSSPSRRHLLGAAPAGLGVLLGGLATPALGQPAALRETADLITGPFYPIVKPAEADADLTHMRGRPGPAAGQVVQLSGRVLTVQGTPVAGAMIEMWQANAAGRYAHPSDPNTAYPLDPDFQGYARLRTDQRGRFRLTTIKPGPYRAPRGDMRAPHIHFMVDGGIDRKVTQLFFPGEPLNATDRHLNSVLRTETLMARVTSAPGSTVMAAEWDVVLARG